MVAKSELGDNCASREDPSSEMFVTATKPSELASDHWGPKPRILVLDIARVVALLAMVVFHFVFDLELFGHVSPGTTSAGFWRGVAVFSASSFVFLAGVGLWLSHRHGIRWAAFGRRLAILLIAAAAVSIATYVVFPDQFVFFGILHSIALSSILGLAFLRLPVLSIAVSAVVVLVAPNFATSAAFDSPWFWWTGLQTVPLQTVDYEPIFPWFAAFLAGMGDAKLASHLGLWEMLSTNTSYRGLGVLTFFGRHTLIVYLIHQPILISAVWAGTLLF